MPRLPSFPPRLPSGATARAGVRPGEKVVAWGRGLAAADAETPFVLATDRALYFEADARRIPWSRISKASWDEPVLTFVALDDRGRPSTPVAVEVPEAGDLPAAVHDRVTASVVMSQRVDLEGHGGALMVARRDSDDGQIRWSVVFDAGLDPTDPALRKAADEALTRLRDSLGI